jgi:hypothetical protein
VVRVFLAASVRVRLDILRIKNLEAFGANAMGMPLTGQGRVIAHPDPGTITDTIAVAANTDQTERTSRLTEDGSVQRDIQ